MRMDKKWAKQAHDFWTLRRARGQNTQTHINKVT